MTNDPYMDAINAGAAALAKPYRDPDTISAFVETFPTIAAARVIDAALSHLRATIIAETIPPGPCPATEQVPALSPNGPQNLVALCDLRAGHIGQHEADDINHGHFRWSDPAPMAEERPQVCDSGVTGIKSQSGVLLWCERTSGHPSWHIAGTHVWDGRGEVVLT